MQEEMTMYAAVVFRHEPTIRRAMAFRAVPGIGHRVRATIEGRRVVGVVEGVEHDTDAVNSLDTCPITIYCVEAAEGVTDV